MLKFNGYQGRKMANVNSHLNEWCLPTFIGQVECLQLLSGNICRCLLWCQPRFIIELIYGLVVTSVRKRLANEEAIELTRGRTLFLWLLEAHLQIKFLVHYV